MVTAHGQNMCGITVGTQACEPGELQQTSHHTRTVNHQHTCTVNKSSMEHAQAVLSTRTNVIARPTTSAFFSVSIKTGVKTGQGNAEVRPLLIQRAVGASDHT